MSMSAQVATWLRDNHRARFARDPATDLWQRMYRYRRGRRGRFALISLGPNGVRDRCADAAAARRQTRNQGKPTTGDLAPPPLDDDICAWIGAGRGRGKSRRRDDNGGHLDFGRDSPFRQIHKP